MDRTPALSFGLAGFWGAAALPLHMSSEGTRRPARDHSITLMHVFLLASAAILLVAAATLSVVLGSVVAGRRAPTSARI